MGTQLKVHLSLFTVALFYGATFSMAKDVMPAYIQPYTFILLRVASACLLFFLFHILFVRQKVERKDLLPLFITSIFGVAANMLMFFKGLSITTPINGAVLMMVTPIFVFIISSVIAAERVGLLKIAGIALAALGAVMLMGGSRFSFSSDTFVGDIYIILNALSYAIYLVYVKKLILKYKAVTVSKWNFIFGLLLVLPFGYPGLEAVQWHTFTPWIWFSVVFILVGTTFITYLLNAWALQHASSTLVGSYIYLQPVIATSIALFTGKDLLTPEKIIFILLIFIGVYLVAMTQKQKN